ncbi:hypothetical protein FQN51_000910 [Onygenales sp. PD_10]|nr:hypothetical protein FQN51_000910 [Onygenales sp. PD_10]
MASPAVNNPGSLGGRKDDIKDNKYGISVAEIQTDLTPGKGRPEWIFSCYGPGKNAPIQLFGGPQREQSFEEMRVLHYAAAAAGNPQQAVQDAMKLYAETEAQMQTILKDTEGAIRYILEGENTHPNRIDVIEGRTGPVTPSPFGQPSAFSQPPAAAQPAAPAFGQPSTPSPFGQPAAVGQQPAFGKPSFGQPSGFGQPSALGAGQPAFGQPSNPAAPAFGQSPFAQAAQTAQPQQNPLGFGQPTPSPFAQAQTQNQQQPSPFGQQSVQPSPFGQPSAQNVQPSPFGQPQQQTPFGQPQAPSPFGQPSNTLNTTAQPSPFGTQQPAAAPTQPNPFSSPLAQAPTTATTTTTTATTSQPAISKKAKPNLNPLPHLTGETRRDPVTQKLISWKGRPVKYIEGEPCYQHPDDAATFVHIFFPDGPPRPEALKDAVGPPEEYTPDVEAAYRLMKETGSFKNGLVPEVPPRVEWCSFDL